MFSSNRIVPQYICEIQLRERDEKLFQKLNSLHSDEEKLFCSMECGVNPFGVFDADNVLQPAMRNLSNCVMSNCITNSDINSTSVCERTLDLIIAILQSIKDYQPRAYFRRIEVAVIRFSAKNLAHYFVTGEISMQKMWQWSRILTAVIDVAATHHEMYIRTHCSCHKYQKSRLIECIETAEKKFVGDGKLFPYAFEQMKSIKIMRRQVSRFMSDSRPKRLYLNNYLGKLEGFQF